MAKKSVDKDIPNNTKMVKLNNSDAVKMLLLVFDKKFINCNFSRGDKERTFTGYVILDKKRRK